MNIEPPDFIIISGGSEIVGLALAEAAQVAGKRYVVLSLVANSILRDTPACVGIVDLSHLLHNWDALPEKFIGTLSKLSNLAARKLPIFPTEDGGLRLLNECRDEVLKYGEFSRARALRMGGLDKAEIIEFASTRGRGTCVSTSIVLDDPTQAPAAIEKLGLDAVFKPALKPIHMDLSPLGNSGTKIVTQQDHSESINSIVTRLSNAWAISERWIAQPRFNTGPNRERSVCAVRDQHGHVQARQVIERAKYPSTGGTAYWVCIDEHNDLLPSATSIMDAFEIIGVCELSYLPDAQGIAQLIEFNTRPWLQIGLMERSGFPIVASSIAALNGNKIEKTTFGDEYFHWMQLERFLVALSKGECSARHTMEFVNELTKKTTTVAGFGSSLPGIRWRLLARFIQKLHIRQRVSRQN
ncbi:hypothetical protein [Xanthomonas medicagonis]|uniref:hypothetical protein n=1 Tax=Xanthomonas medicagonis TaxID=3160841 RepID=UPI0035123B1F